MCICNNNFIEQFIFTMVQYYYINLNTAYRFAFAIFLFNIFLFDIIFINNVQMFNNYRFK